MWLTAWKKEESWKCNLHILSQSLYRDRNIIHNFNGYCFQGTYLTVRQRDNEFLNSTDTPLKAIIIFITKSFQVEECDIWELWCFCAMCVCVFFVFVDRGNDLVSFFKYINEGDSMFRNGRIGACALGRVMVNKTYMSFVYRLCWISKRGIRKSVYAFIVPEEFGS